MPWRMRVRSKGVCGIFSFGVRKRCCTACRGTTRGSRLSAEFSARGDTLMESGERRTVSSDGYQLFTQLPRLALGIVGDIAVGIEVVEPVLLREAVHPV